MRIGAETKRVIVETKLEAFHIKKAIEQLLLRLSEQPATKQNQRILEKALQYLNQFIES